MPHYVGLDVSQKTTAICVVDEQGRRLWRGACVTDPGAISARVLRHAGVVDVKVGIETGSMTPWLVHGLRSAGLDVECLDARRVKAALQMRLNKTDENDAEGLAPHCQENRLLDRSGFGVGCGHGYNLLSPASLSAGHHPARHLAVPSFHLELSRCRGAACRAWARHLLRERSQLGAQIRTDDRSQSAAVPPATERPMASRRNGRADRGQACVPVACRRP